MQLVCSFKLLMALLGSSCLPFGPIWLQNGLQNGPKMVPKWLQKLVQKMIPKMMKKGPKMDPKMNPKMDRDRLHGGCGDDLF